MRQLAGRGETSCSRRRSRGSEACWKLVPETKGKHLEDIQAEFQARVDKHNAPA
jgi:hypothetical protein